MKKIITSLALLAGLGLSAQVKVGDNVTTLAPGSLFEMESTNKGLMLPRVALTATTAILPVLGTHAQAAGMVVYNTANAGDVTPGVYANDGTKWVKVGAGAASTAFDVTTEITGNYSVLANDGFVKLNITAPGFTLTLPTSGVAVGKVVYVSNIGNNAMEISPAIRNTSFSIVQAGASGAFVYLGGTGAGSWDWVAGF